MRRSPAPAGPAQVTVEVLGRPPVRAATGEVAHHDAAGEGPRALVVVVVRAVVADVGVRERDDLPGVAGVGQHLLVTGEHGVEHHLSPGDAAGRLRADELALERRADPHRWASASITTGSPPRTVWRTRPLSAMPAYGVLRLRLASLAGSTVHVADGSTTHRLAGRPAATGPPWASPAPRTAAGRHDSSASTSATGRSRCVSASASAVSKPNMPGGAWSNGCSLVSGACGA